MFGPLDNIPTTVHKRIQPPAERSPMVARSLTGAQAASTIETPVAARPSAMRVVLERVGWLSLGIGGTLAVTLFVVPALRSEKAAPMVQTQPVAVAAAPAPVVEKVAPAPVVAPVVAPAVVKAAAAPVVTPPPVPAAPIANNGIEPPPVPPVAPAATKFDLTLAAKNATTAARQCFGAVDHTVSFGTGLLFSKEDAVARRTFLSPDEPLSADERKCLKNALLYVSAGAPPDKNTIAEFRFKIRPGDGSKDVATFTIPK